MITIPACRLALGRRWQWIKHISRRTLLPLSLPLLLHIDLLCQLVEDVVDLVADGRVLLVLHIPLDLRLLASLNLGLEPVVELADHQVEHLQAARDVRAESGQV